MPADIIAPRLLTPGGLLVLGGAPKVGKSDFVISLLAHAAAGVPFLGFAPPRPLRVFYLQAEIQYHYLRERFQGTRLPTAVLAAARDNLVATPKVKMLLDANGVARAVEAIQTRFPDEPPDVICIDPIRNLFDGGPEDSGENSNDAMLFFLQERVEVLREIVNPDAGVVLCHHTKKITKKLLAEDPFQALSGASSLRGFYTSGILMCRPDEDRPERKLFFELRNGPAIEPRIVDKVGGQWVEIDRRGERLVRKDHGEKLDAERRRKHDVILQLLYDEAADGRVYTGAQFADRFENQAGLGGKDTIRERLGVLTTKGYVKFFRNHEDVRPAVRPPARSSATCASRTCISGRPKSRSMPTPARSSPPAGGCSRPTTSALRAAPCCPSRTPRCGSIWTTGRRSDEPHSRSAIFQIWKFGARSGSSAEFWNRARSMV